MGETPATDWNSIIFVTIQHPNRGPGLYYKSNFCLIFLATLRPKTKNKKFVVSTS
jgi:hypothetical protein